MTAKTTKTTLRKANLKTAENGSWYTILGVGGDPQDWVDGIEGLLAEKGIGKPKAWFKTTGRAINEYVGEVPRSVDEFPGGLFVLMFPLDGLDVGKLAIFKLEMQDRWFDDVVDNMRERG